MTNPKTCADCIYLVTEEGEPYFCALKPLYTFVESSDEACNDYEPD